MCDCTYKQQADAWMAVWDALMQGNPSFVQGSNGQSSAVNEIRRLQERAARTTLTEAALETVRRERDAQNHRANETLKLLEKERATSDQLAKELVKSRDELARAQSPLSPIMGGGAEKHRQNVRQAVQRYARVGAPRAHMTRVAEAVYYLLDRDQLQTAAIKRLSERLDALEPNAKQPAAQRPMAPPWEMQPSGGFNPG